MRSPGRAAVAASCAGLLLALLAAGEAAGAAEQTNDPVQGARDRVVRASAAHAGDHPELADAYEALGRALLTAQALDEAEDAIRKGYEMRRRLRGEESLDVARSLHQLGDLDDARLNHRVALEHHVRALAIRRHVLGNEHPDVAESLKKVAFSRTAISEWGLGVAILREAVALQRRVLPEDDPRLVTTLVELGDRLRWQNELAEAEEVLREAVEILSRTPNAEADLAEGLETLAMLHRFKREHDEAEPLLARTIAMRKRYLGDANLATLISRANLAMNHAYQGRHAEADREFEALRKVVTDAPEGVDLRVLVELLDTYMAAAAEAARNWPATEKYVRASLASMERKNHAAGIVGALRRLGEARAAQGDLVEAERLFERAAVVYEEARLKMSPGTPTAAFHKTPYEQLALYRLENGRPDEAWEALESARARLLADHLLPARPEAAARGAPTRYSLSRIQARLGPGEAIVAWLDGELYQGSVRSWACVIRRSGPVRWVRLPAERSLDSLSAMLCAFRDGLGDGASSALGMTGVTLPRESHEIWKKRFRPLEPLLGGVRDLVLVPSWAMGSFPVEMLTDANGRYVGERFATSHAPSATIFAWLLETRPRDWRTVRTGLLLGDPPFRKDALAYAGEENASDAQLRSALRGDALAIAKLPRLKHSRDEVAGVAGLLAETRVLVGRDASEPALASLARSGALSRFDIVHIATHALIDSETPHRSGLVLSQLGVTRSEALEAGRDGIVTGEEIQESWKLGAHLVTLSACRTALGRTIFGEGVVGLSYPLLEAGARSVLVSQWKVDDEATALLMKRFYRNWLGAGAWSWTPRMSKAAALREAKQWLRRHETGDGDRPFAHPFYWAAFILVGDPG